jgi:putative Holliday junction resolvase
MVKYLGLDVGEARIGIAISDPSGSYALPLMALDRKSIEQDTLAIQSLAKSYQVENTIVVGVPISLKGSITIQTKIILDFCDHLSKALDYQFVTWNESNTTLEAERILRNSGKKPSRNRGTVDATAASIILQDYINHTKNLKA